MISKNGHVFKIMDEDTGLFSSGGYYPSFSKTGKDWTSMGQVLSHLKLYRRGHPYDHKDAERAGKKFKAPVIPKSWIIIEYQFVQCSRGVSARDSIK